MKNNSSIQQIVPVLPSSDIIRDISWYREKTGFREIFHDEKYAVLKRESFYIHLQWHAGTEDDPLLGGSVIRVFVKNIRNIFEEFVQRGTVDPGRFISNTPWRTNEFGFYDLNNNAVFIVEDIE